MSGPGLCILSRPARPSAGERRLTLNGGLDKELDEELDEELDDEAGEALLLRLGQDWGKFTWSGVSARVGTNRSA